MTVNFNCQWITWIYWWMNFTFSLFSTINIETSFNPQTGLFNATCYQLLSSQDYNHPFKVFFYCPIMNYPDPCLINCNIYTTENSFKISNCIGSVNKIDNSMKNKMLIYTYLFNDIPHDLIDKDFFCTYKGKPSGKIKINEFKRQELEKSDLIESVPETSLSPVKISYVNRYQNYWLSVANSRLILSIILCMSLLATLIINVFCLCRCILVSHYVDYPRKFIKMGSVLIMDDEIRTLRKINANKKRMLVDRKKYQIK